LAISVSISTEAGTTVVPAFGKGETVADDA